MNCYFSKNYKNLTGAGNRAKRDVETIIDSIGYSNIGSQPSFHSNKAIALVATLWSVLKAVVQMKQGDVILLQYPLKKHYSYFCKAARMKGAKTITLVHDLGSFRRRKLTPAKEIKRLSRTDCVIALNKSMKEWLEQQGSKVPIVTLDVWDYLSDSSAAQTLTMNPEPKIVYAGGLSNRKNSFLYEIGDYVKNYGFNLYGSGFNLALAKGSERFNYFGFIPSDHLIESVEGDFGLVWDGDSVEECSGNWGEYLKYNNPHKSSLYIRCHLPLIVWREAAMAKFVEQQGIGITIDSLSNLDETLGRITAADYKLMRERVVAMSHRLNEGYYLKRAMQMAIEHL